MSRFLEALRQGAIDPWFASRYHGGGKGSTPPAPDYKGAAEADAAANKEALATQTWANRPNVNTPWGSQTWDASVGVDPATGQKITNWTQNINLSPEQQAANDAQQRITAGRSEAAETLLGQATGAFDTPFNWDSLPGAPGEAAHAGNVTDSQNAAYAQMSQMLQPGRNQQQAALDTKLANMGLPMGSEAQRRANTQLSDQWAGQDRQMMQTAMEQGRQNVGQQFNMDQSQINQQQQLRNNAIAEEAQRRGMSLNELNALLTGQQVNMPQMPGFSQASMGAGGNNLQAANMSGNYGLQAQQAAQAGATDWGALAGTVAMGAMMM